MSGDLLKAAFEQHLDDCTSRDAALIDRVHRRLMAHIQMGVRAGPPEAADGEWESLSPGFDRKVLNSTGAVHSYLVRLAPGARASSHWHTENEECLVLEGSIQIGDVALEAGNYHFAPKGSRHGDALTDTGVLMFVRGAFEVAEDA